MIEEVRAIRQAHAERFGFDLKRIAEDLKKSRAQIEWPVASPSPKRDADARNKS